MVFILLNTIFFGCNNDEVLVSQESPSYISFDSPESLWESLGELDVKEYDTFLASIAPPSFQSYDAYFEQIEEEIAERERRGTLPPSLFDLEKEYPLQIGAYDDGYEFEPIVSSLLISRITNRDRVVRFGDELYQYGVETVTIAPIDKVTDPTDLSTAKDFRTEQYIEIPMDKNRGDLEGICNDEYVWDGSDHRLKPRWYVRNKVKTGSIYFLEIYIEIKHQKRGFLGAWYANQEDEISAVGDIVYYMDYEIPDESVGVNETRTNVSKVKFYVVEEPRSYPLSDSDPPGDRIVAGSDVLHSSQDGGASASCRIIK